VEAVGEVERQGGHDDDHQDEQRFGHGLIVGPPNLRKPTRAGLAGFHSPTVHVGHPEASSTP
jgi:hypothetical protein